MSNSLSWKNTTSLNIDSSDTNNSSLLVALNSEAISLYDKDRIKKLENQKNYYILEDDFIESSKNLITIIRKYIDKDFTCKSKIYIPTTHKFKEINGDPRDKDIYEKITGDNKIDGEIRKFPISVNVLNKALCTTNPKSLLIIDYFILLVLSNKSSFSAEDLSAEFKHNDKSFKIELNLDSKPLNLFPLYDWIFNRENYKESYEVKINIVRQVIINKQSLKDIKGLIEDSNLAFNRIVSNKTDDYFTQLNQLKDDFLILAQNERSAVRTLNLTFFAWLGYLGFELFKIIVNYNKLDIISYLLFSSGPKKGIVIAMFIMALIFIFTAYAIEIKSLGKTYDVIKGIYKDKILFETEGDNKFEAIIEKPKIGKLQNVVFKILIIILFVRFLYTLPW